MREADSTPRKRDSREVIRRFRMFIDGSWVEAASGERFESINPFTGEVWASFPVAGPSDVDGAVASARRAFPAWRDALGKERALLLRRLADLIAARSEELAAIETRDNGKLIREMLGQMKGLPDYYQYWAGWADKVQGDVVPLDRPTVFHYVLREALGAIAAIVPWNSPLLLLTWKLAPALALGNVVVAKPAEQTSASTLEFASLVEEANFPQGVFNVVTGPGRVTGAALASHPNIDKVSFTGGIDTARSIARAAGENIVPLSLELGGKSPNIVFEDADLTSAASGVIAGIFGASGQSCSAGSRLLVQESVADTFVKNLIDRASLIRLGDPSDPTTEMGPVCFPEQLQKIERYVHLGAEEGAEVLTGGKRPSGDPILSRGLFYEPTILGSVRNDMRVAREEIFGPVLAVMPFRDEEHALEIANDSDFGLAAGIWTRDIGRALRVAHRVEAGIVWINTYRAASYAAPWGGFKRSGYGRELGVEAIREYTQPKSVWIDIGEGVADPFVLR